MKTFKVGQRVKRGLLRGTVLKIVTLTGVKNYSIRMDNGVFVKGSVRQFEPVRKS